MVLNRVDTASAVAVAQWKKYLVTEGGLRADNRGGNVPVFFVDSKRGRGVHEVCVCVCVCVCLSVCRCVSVSCVFSCCWLAAFPLSFAFSVFCTSGVLGELDLSSRDCSFLATLVAVPRVKTLSLALVRGSSG